MWILGLKGLVYMTETSDPGYTSKNLMTHQSAINSFNNQIKIQDPKDLDKFILTSYQQGEVEVIGEYYSAGELRSAWVRMLFSLNMPKVLSRSTS